jgi:hypothetical protein
LQISMKKTEVKIEEFKLFFMKIQTR